MPQPLFQKVDCLMLYVSDLDEALAFYRDRLGHPLIWRTGEAAGLRMPGTDTEIVLRTGERGTEVDLLVLLDTSKGLLLTDEQGNVIGNQPVG